MNATRIDSTRQVRRVSHTLWVSVGAGLGAAFGCTAGMLAALSGTGGPVMLMALSTLGAFAGAILMDRVVLS